jgi:hypothetical protein
MAHHKKDDEDSLQSCREGSGGRKPLLNRLLAGLRRAQTGNPSGDRAATRRVRGLSEGGYNKLQDTDIAMYSVSLRSRLLSQQLLPRLRKMMDRMLSFSLNKRHLVAFNETTNVVNTSMS